MRSFRAVLTSVLPLFALALAATLSGCGGGGNTHTFRYTPERGEDLGGSRVVVLFTVEDLRKDIVEGDEPLSWVGEQRSGTGIPHTVTTTDGRPFATVVRETLQRDLEAAGFRTALVDEARPEDLAGAIAGRRGERGLAVTMRAFNSNTYSDIDLVWDFEALVYGREGQVLAANRVRGEQELQGSVIHPSRAAKEKVPPFFYGLMRELVVGNQTMLAALGGAADATAPAPGGRRCTIDQILKMRDSGLSEEQIEAACGASPSGGSND